MGAAMFTYLVLARIFSAAQEGTCSDRLVALRFTVRRTGILSRILSPRQSRPEQSRAKQSKANKSSAFFGLGI